MPTDPDARDLAEPTPRQRATRSATDEKILDAVLHVARKKGLAAVTIDDVSQESGVAKTTIYRRYDDRFDMLADIAQRVSAPQVNQEPSYTREGLTDGIRQIQDYLEERVGLRIIAGLLGSSEEFITEWRSRVIAPAVDRFNIYFQDGVKSGYFTDVDGEFVAKLVLGGMVMTYALDGDVPDDYPDRVMEGLWPAIAGPKASD